MNDRHVPPSKYSLHLSDQSRSRLQELGLPLLENYSKPISTEGWRIIFDSDEIRSVQSLRHECLTILSDLASKNVLDLIHSAAHHRLFDFIENVSYDSITVAKSVRLLAMIILDGSTSCAATAKTEWAAAIGGNMVLGRPSLPETEDSIASDSVLLVVNSLKNQVGKDIGSIAMRLLCKIIKDQTDCGLIDIIVAAGGVPYLIEYLG